MGRKFEISIRDSVVLDVEEIWPDGDAPEYPTASDVQAVLAEEGGIVNSVSSVLVDWSIDDDFEFAVSEVG